MEDQQFLIFGWSAHDECGGWSDFQGVANSLDAAKKYISDKAPENVHIPHGYCWQVVDMKTYKVVYEE